MIIVRSPFRISFFGGGTDYPSWYLKNNGKVISTSINKYCYITIRELPKIFSYNYRVRYYDREETNSISEIKHPVVRSILDLYCNKKNLDIVHHADLPARSGLGSSSAFTVALLHAIYSFNNKMITKRRLACEAINIEQNILKENVGSQDQIASSFGGLNVINFYKNNKFDVLPLMISDNTKNKLLNSCLLFFTGFTRIASEIAHEQINNLKENETSLNSMLEIVDEGYRILTESFNIKDFGNLMNEQWLLKKTLSNQVSNEQINKIYLDAINAGAYGGKLLGAGGGGFILFIAPKKNHSRIINKLSKLQLVPFKFDSTGSQVIYYAP